jgi:hypothetical protein
LDSCREIWGFLFLQNVHGCDKTLEPVVGITITPQAGISRLDSCREIYVFLFLQNVQTGCAAQPASYSEGAGYIV